jgi:hypothetical protein
MDATYEVHGTSFRWDKDKAQSNLVKHGVSFEVATMVFFDPFLRIEDASRNEESRDAVIGFDEHERLLYVVHIEVEDEYIRIISARKATSEERQRYDQ